MLLAWWNIWTVFHDGRNTPSHRKNIVDLHLLLIYTILCGDYENEKAIA